METPKVIEGLTILQKYRTEPHGWHLGAEHDVIYAFATDMPVNEEDFNHLIKLGWVQNEVFDKEDEFEFNSKYDSYKQDESWMCYI